MTEQTLMNILTQPAQPTKASKKSKKAKNAIKTPNEGNNNSQAKTEETGINQSAPPTQSTKKAKKAKNKAKNVPEKVEVLIIPVEENKNESNMINQPPMKEAKKPKKQKNGGQNPPQGKKVKPRFNEMSNSELLLSMLSDESEYFKKKCFKRLAKNLEKYKEMYSVLEKTLMSEIQKEYERYYSQGFNPVEIIVTKILEVYSTTKKKFYYPTIQRLLLNSLQKMASLYWKDWKRKEVQAIGLEYWKSLDLYNLGLYLDIFGIRKMINPEEVIPKIEEWTKQKEYFIAAKYIVMFKLQAKFDLAPIAINLAQKTAALRENLLIRLITDNPELQRLTLDECMKSNKPGRLEIARKIAKRFHLSIDQYPGFENEIAEFGNERNHEEDFNHYDENDWNHYQEDYHPEGTEDHHYDGGYHEHNANGWENNGWQQPQWQSHHHHWQQQPSWQNNWHHHQNNQHYHQNQNQNQNNFTNWSQNQNQAQVQYQNNNNNNEFPQDELILSILSDKPESYKKRCLKNLAVEIETERVSYGDMNAILMVAIEEMYRQYSYQGMNPTEIIINKIMDAYFATRRPIRSPVLHRLFLKILEKMKTLYWKDFETEGVQAIGMIHWKAVDCHHLDTMLDVFGIRELINPEEIIPKIEKSIRDKNFFSSAKYIVIMNLQAKFDLIPIMKNIVQNPGSLKDGILVRLITGNPEVQRVTIQEAIKHEKMDVAMKLAQYFAFPLTEFPDYRPPAPRVAKAQEGSGETHPGGEGVDSATIVDHHDDDDDYHDNDHEHDHEDHEFEGEKKEGQENDPGINLQPWDNKQKKMSKGAIRDARREVELAQFFALGNWMQNEEKMLDEIRHLRKYVCSLLFIPETQDIALSIIKRNNILLTKFSIPELEKIGPYFSIPPTQTFNYIENPLFTYDGDGPTEEVLGMNPPNTFLHLSDLGYTETDTIVYIDDAETEEFGKAFKDILCSTEIGLDSEFKWTNKFRVDLVQIATASKIYLFDYDSKKLVYNRKYQEFITCLLTHPELIIIGHSIGDDLDRLGNSLGGNKFKRTVHSIDIYPVFKEMFPHHRASLAAISEKMLGKPLSKFEQISNWTKRPLRKTQVYYAAMDAAVVLRVYEKLLKMQEENPGLYSFKGKEDMIASNENHHHQFYHHYHHQGGYHYQGYQQNYQVYQNQSYKGYDQGQIQAKEK